MPGTLNQQVILNRQWDFDTLNPIDVKEIQTKYGSGKVGELGDGTAVVARQVVQQEERLLK